MRGGHAGIPRQRVPILRIPMGGKVFREPLPRKANRQTNADANTHNPVVQTAPVAQSTLGLLRWGCEFRRCAPTSGP